MPRLVFEKTGNAVWISHLDLMRLFQRAFKRAGFVLKHTQGYNPRPMVSIALPMSVGVESHCELLDFELDGESVPYEELKERLNNTLIHGVRILSVLDSERIIRDIKFLDCSVFLEYDSSVPQDADTRICALFAKASVTVSKKTKNGVQEQDIIPMVKSISLSKVSDSLLRMDCNICCQNPALNPAQLMLAICTYLPELCPDHSWCIRNEIYDQEGTVFR